MKKILFVLESLSGGGAEKVLSTIVENLNREKYDITVYSIVKTGVYVKDIEKYCNLKYALNDYKYYSTFGKLLYKFKIKLIYNLNINFVYRWLIKEKYDIEIAFVEGFDTKLVAASPNKKSKKYAWVHSDMITNPHSDIHFKNINQEKKAYYKFNKIFAVSNDVKKSFIKKFEISNIEVQYNPIDSNEILKLSENGMINYDLNIINMITVGRLENQKGYDRLLKIVKQLKNEHYKFKLYILGEGSQREKYEQYIFENDLIDYVNLLGFKRNPYSYIKNADLFVCSSYAEGFSTVATEAIILGLPIVTTECSGMKELFGEYRCGIITKNDDESLMLGLKKILDNPKLLNMYKDEIELRRSDFDIKIRMNELENILR